MTRMTGPDCAVMCNLINTYIHTYILSSRTTKYATYKTREYDFEKNFWIVRDGRRPSDCAPDDFFQGNFLTPPTQIFLEKNPFEKKSSELFGLEGSK